tara:strand:- start:3492 stop:3677 length:186 start_codon:yes stop_codon:yes gene_type:complete
MKIVEVTPENVHQETLFCIKDIKSPAFESKRKWLLESDVSIQYQVHRDLLLTDRNDLQERI